jgi:hypothetical protein
MRDDLDLPDLPSDGTAAAPGFVSGLGRVRGAALLVLPALIAIAIWFAYQSRSTDDLEAGSGLGAVSGGASAAATVAAAAETPQLPNEGDRPEAIDQDESTTAVGEFSATGPVPAPDQGDTDDQGVTDDRGDAAVAPDSETAEADAAAVANDIEWILGTGGATESQQYLPLAGFAGNLDLPNYDSDRNDDPGLTIQIGSGLEETDPAKIQRWLGVPGEVGRLDGRPALQLWVAVKDFDASKTGRMNAGLYECAVDGQDCNLLARGDVLFRQASFGNDFGRVTINMPEVAATIDTDRVIQLTVGVPDTSDDDLWIAFGTSARQARLSVQ